MEFSPSQDDGGSIITDYVLEISPYLSTAWAPVASYSDNSMSHTVDGTDGLVPYSIYRFRTYAINGYGNSDYSEELAVAVAPLPSQPPVVTKN